MATLTPAIQRLRENLERAQAGNVLGRDPEANAFWREIYWPYARRILLVGLPTCMAGAYGFTLLEAEWVALLFGVFWRRYTTEAAWWTLLGGIGAVLLSLALPQVVTPFAQGVPAISACWKLAGFHAVVPWQSSQLLLDWM